MSDLIDRQAAIDAIDELILARIGWLFDRRRELKGLNAARTAIEKLPPAQPERKNGKWIEKEGNAYKCSCCGKQIITNPDYIKAHKFCFSCGADMRGEEQDG